MSRRVEQLLLAKVTIMQFSYQKPLYLFKNVSSLTSRLLLIEQKLTSAHCVSVAAMSSYLYIVKSELPLVIQAFLKAEPNSE